MVVLKTRDKDGYIITASDTETPIIKYYRQANYYNSTSSVKEFIHWHDRLGLWYFNIASFITTRILSPNTIHFLAQTFLYPFLSGAFSGAVSWYRSWKLLKRLNHQSLAIKESGHHLN